jgi:hypothetical protein
MMVLPNHNVYGFGSVRWSGSRPLSATLRAMTLADDIAAEVNREDATLERGHHGRGRLVIIPRALWPNPERTLVASDRMARIDVKSPLRIATVNGARGQISGRCL